MITRNGFQRGVGLESRKTSENRSGGLSQVALTVAQRKAELEQVYRAKHAGFSHLIRLALNEAEALAWETGFPQLVFNGLAEEKIQAVASWNRRQSEIRQNRSAELSLAA